MKTFYLLTAFILAIFLSGFTPDGNKNYKANDNFSSKFHDASLELKKEINSPNFLSDKRLKEKTKESFALTSKSKELGISESKLKSLLDPIDSMQTEAMNQELTITGTTDSKTGTSVASAGDVNGDGYSDIIVGAPGYNSNTGRAFIYFGGANMDNIPEVILTGESSNSNFGGNVSSAGDINGDGYSDVIVAANGYNSNTGRAYIYCGGNNMDGLVDVYLNSPQANISFGSSVSGTGDVNGDGFSDVIVGAPSAENLTGKAYLYYGGSSMNNTIDLTMSGEALNDGLGLYVSAGGDFNGDGYNDVLLSAPRYGSFTGRVYLYYGGVNMNNIADVIFTGEGNGNQFGSSATNAGDINGDGYSDVIIGAHAYDLNRGRAYIYKGGAIPNNFADLILTGEATSTLFGASVSSAGDMNGDGFSDVIVGAYGYNTFKGKACIYFGGINMNAEADAKFTTDVANSRLGASVSSAGDLDNDGYSEIVIGAYSYSSNIGRTYVYSNKLTGMDIADEIYTPGSEYSYLGSSVGSAGDVNNDGYSDVIIGAPGYPSTNDRRGIAYIYFGGINSDNIADVTLYGLKPGDYFGCSVSTAGDMNGDGYDDVIVGAYGKDTTHGIEQGGAYIYLGGASMNNIADVVLTGLDTGSYFGSCVSTAGDMNGDGYSDVIIGAPATDNDNRENGDQWGGAYICLGGSNMTSYMFYLESENDYDENYLRFGFSVSTAGDINGDGYSDAIVGAPGYDSFKGKVNIFYGRNFLNSFPNLTIQEEVISTSNDFGYSIACAGDVNGDGYGDIFIGALGNDAGGNNAGKAYIYYGGINMNSIPDITFTGNAAYQSYGENISGAGDVNNDGYSDVIVTVAGYPEKSYIFFGGISMDNVPDIQMNQQLYSTEGFGKSLACAGDVNGDGLSDVVIGAPDNNGAVFGGGRAYLFISSAPAIIPRVSNVKDVPNDEGGFVNVGWVRSGYDVRGIDRVTNYIIERSKAPGAAGYQWEQIANVTALNNPMYMYTAATWSDSISGSNGNTFYRVTARTANNSEYWRSNILSGHSVDNLSPSSPINLFAAGASNRINLNWNANTEADLKDYLIYRNDVNISSSLSNIFSDSTALADSSYIYKIAARDIHGNISPLSNPDTASLESITIYNVTVIPEGLLNTATNQLRMRDTIKAYLWDLTGSVLVDSATGILDSVTFKTDLTFKYAPSGTYYLALIHRNCIETWSKVGGEAYTRGASITYDFTSANSQAYGNNLRLKGGKYCMYSGDVNRSGVVNSTDRTLIKNNVGLIGYLRFDLDGNGVVNSSDRTIVRSNTGISRQRP